MKNSILEKARWLRDVALATSKNNGARVAREWLKYAAMFVMLFTIGSGNVWAETHTLGWGSATGSQGTYTNFTATSGTVTDIVSFTTAKNSSSNNPAYNSNNSDLRLYYHSGGNGGSITLTPASGVTITGFTITTSTSPTTKYKVDNGGLTQITLSQNTGSVSGLSVGSSSSITIQNCNTSNTQLRIKTIAITYTAEGTFHTLSSAVSPAESGSVELSATSVAEGSTATATATPAAHYVFDHWSISGTGSSLSSTTTNPTTVTMGTADATVTATFVAAPKASITLSEAGATTTDATTYYVGDSYTLPSSTGASCGTKVLVGWSTVAVSETDIKPASNFYEKGETVTLEASQTFYAVFANASGGGGGAPTAYTAGDEGTYVLAIYVSGTWYALPANPTVSSGKISGVEITVSNTGGVDYVTNADGFEWTIANATNGQTISDGSNYIYHSNGGSSGTNLTYGNGTTYTWTIESEQNGLTFKGTNGTTVGSRGLLASGTTFGGYSLSNEDASGYYRIHVLPIGGGTTYSAYSTTCQACVAPTSVTITGTNKYLGGQTISLTATPDGGTGTPSYQWQKKISGVWRNLANDGSISGVASNNLQISSCTHANSGGYRCIVSTGDGCETKSHADGTDGYGVHVFSIHGKYTTDADYSDTEIIWTSETTGTATISMDAKKTYLFKVWSNNGNYYGHGANTNEDFMFQPTTWDCGVNNNEMRLFTTVAGNYTFTVNIEHGLDGSPYVNVQVGYPSMTHPNSGYVYVQKFNWQPYLHYWYDNSHPLSTWGSDPQLAANQYTSICGTDYWCVPVIDYYCNFIAKDAAGNPSNTTGDQHTNSPHPGQRLYNDGSWKWGEFSTYTIAYAGGDGSTGGPMASHTGLCPGSSQQLTANAFSKAYHTFNGWSDGNGHTYADQAMIENIQSNINLTAQWTKTPVEELLLNYSELNKYVGDPAVTLEVTGVTPEGADASVTWSSSNSSVASVVAATGVVTFGTVGTATITVTSTVTGTTMAYCHVTVRNKPTATFVDLIHDGNGTDLSKYNMQNVAGTAIVFPTLDDYATPGDDCDTKHYVFVGWTTSDNNDDPQDHLVASGELEDGQDKVFYAVWADGVEGVSYTKLTSNSFDGSPAKYVIGVESGGDTYYLYNCASTDANNSWGYTTNAPGTNAPIQFTLSGTADALVATSTEASARYLTPLTAKNFQMSAKSKTVKLNSDGTIHNTGDNSAWNLRGNSTNLRWYDGTTGTSAYFYKITAGAAVSYRTSCCTNNVPAPTVIATNTAYTVTLTWGAVDGATGYEVSWNGGAFEAATSPCVKSGLTASMDYIYKVRATYDPLVKCGALVASGNVTTDDVYSVTYSGGTGTGSCSPSGSVAPVSYEAGATVTLAPTNSFSMTSNTFAAWVVKDAENNDVAVSNNQFTMPASNVTVTATWTAVQDKYYDRMHQSTDASHGGIADGNGKYYIVREGCNYTVPSPADDSTGDTDCHTTHFKLLGWIAQSHLKSDGSIKDGEESYIFQGGTIKSATGATYYAVYAIMTE